MRNILVVYHYYGQYPPRTTKWDHLVCFRRYSGYRCFYLNLAFHRVPWYITKIKFDLVIFQTLFFNLRWSRAAFRRFMKKAAPLKQIDAVKVALPQDEFVNTDLVGDFINEFDLDYVFSVAPETEWPKIYDTVDLQKVTFFNVLTGYLSDTTMARINELAESTRIRSIDIGYRSGGYRDGQSDPTLGRHGFLKGQIAQAFQEKVPQTGLVTDISNHLDDIFLGDEWYKFLLRCKYTLGVESGSSLLDRDGRIRQKIEAYLACHPLANFDEIEAECFPNLDGSVDLFAIAPRHLEACATRTCQVLTEGAYNNILIAGKHYIELKRDFSNIDQVLDIIKQDEQREEIVQRAYRDLVASGRYSYRGFVDFVIQKSLSHTRSEQQTSSSLIWFYWMRSTDILSWTILALLSGLHTLLKTALPARAMKSIKVGLVKWFLS